MHLLEFTSLYSEEVGTVAMTNGLSNKEIKGTLDLAAHIVLFKVVEIIVI